MRAGSIFFVLFVGLLLMLPPSAMAGMQPPAAQAAAPREQAEAAAPAWPPEDVDDSVPAVRPDATCSLRRVLARAGEKVEELVRNLARFAATENLEHYNVDGSGRLKKPKTRHFKYVVSLQKTKNGYWDVDEYRDGHKNNADFPDGIATMGTPAIILIFHPRYVRNFNMECEGLGEWEGHPAWQIHFEERPDTQSPISILTTGSTVFRLLQRGRAWILADSYQVARIETDLVKPVREARLRLQHQSIEYRPQRLPHSRVYVWLPARVELYMDFRGHRFYRQHSFTDFELYSVSVHQEISRPK